MASFLSRRFPVVLGACLIVGLTLGPQGSVLAETGSLDKTTLKLFEAVHANRFADVQASVSAGADVGAVDQWGMTPIELAIDKGYFQIAHYLVRVQNFRREGTKAAARRATPVPVETTELSTTDNPASPPTTKTRGVGLDKSGRVLGASAAASPIVELETSGGAAPAPVWPAGKPNPFDPQVAAPGSNLLVIGEVGGSQGEALAGFGQGGADLPSQATKPQ